jgi:hypothetical protein
MISGRLALLEALKRWGDLRGNPALDVLEQLQPVVAVDSLERTPYSLAIPFTLYFSSAAGGAGTYNGVSVRLAVGAPDNTWIQFDRMVILGGAAKELRVDVTTSAQVGNTASVTVLPTRLAGNTGDLGGLGVVDAWRGTQGSQPSPVNMRFDSGHWHQELHHFAVTRRPNVADSGYFNAVDNAVNATLNMALFGRVHFTTAR